MHAREAAFLALLAWLESKTPVQETLDESRGKLDARDAALARTLAAGVVRQERTLLYLVNRCLDRPSKLAPPLRASLDLGAYQLVYMPSIPAHAALSETVGLLRDRKKRGFCNAVLRRLQRGLGEVVNETGTIGHDARSRIPIGGGRVRQLLEPALPESTSPVRFLGLRLSYPDAVVSRFLDIFGLERTESILRAQNEPPGLCVRLLGGRRNRDEAIEELAKGGIEARPSPASPRAIRLPPGTAVTALPGFAEGDFYVQAEAQQQIMELLPLRTDDDVLDLCAAPGGKTIFALDATAPGGRVTSVDIDGDRLKMVRESAARLGFESRLTLVLSDARSLDAPARLFDAVIVDVPCSNDAVMGRRVEVRWRLPSLDRRKLQVMQDTLLRAGANHVRPGGHLLYSTCSLDPSENEERVELFHAEHPEFEIRNTRTILPEAGTDGGFGALLLRSPEARLRTSDRSEAPDPQIEMLGKEQPQMPQRDTEKNG